MTFIEKFKDPRVKKDWPVMGFLAVIHVFAIPALFTFSWGAFAAFLILYFLSGCIGITMGFHRLFTHRSFKANPWLERVAGVCGVMAMQGGIAEWVAHHRMHHAGSDTERDPHNAREGFWHSHMTWLFWRREEFDDSKRIAKFSRDIHADPFLAVLSTRSMMIFIQVFLGMALYILGGWPFVWWGIFMRLVCVYHATWLVNSASHIWGYKNTSIDDRSKNCWWVAVLTFGEGWHNNHHACAERCRAGIKWWEFDVTFWMIRLFSALGLAHGIKGTPPPDADKDTPAAIAISASQ